MVISIIVVAFDVPHQSYSADRSGEELVALIERSAATQWMLMMMKIIAVAEARVIEMEWRRSKTAGGLLMGSWFRNAYRTLLWQHTVVIKP